MASGIETSVVQVGLRDFLFYVVPGATILVGIFAFEGIAGSDLRPYLGIASSIAAILGSYVLGQCAYYTAYFVRRLLNQSARLNGLDGEEDERFRRAYRWIAKYNPVYFSVEVFRYRTLARFCSLMVLPTLFVAAGMAFGRWPLTETERIIGGTASVLASIGFIYRYRRYESRYRSCLQSRRSSTAQLKPGPAVKGV